jgi:hypothetical protein
VGVQVKYWRGKTYIKIKNNKKLEGKRFETSCKNLASTLGV